MEFETEKPTCAGFTARGNTCKDTMLSDAWIFTDREDGRIGKGYACACEIAPRFARFPEERIQVSTEWHDCRSCVLDKPIVADKMRERFLQVSANQTQIEVNASVPSRRL